RQTATKIYHRRIYEQFHELLAFKDSTELIQQGKEIGLPTSAYWMIAILEIPKFAIDLQYLDIEIHQIVARLNREFDQTEKLIYGFYNKIIVLISLSEANHVHDVEGKLHVIRTEGKWN